MKSIEFAYWLQGAFDLNETTTVTAKQLKIIKNHLAMVQYHEENKTSKFCNFLQGFFDMADPASLSEEQVTKIKLKLKEATNHNYPSSSNHRRGSGDLVAMC